MDRYITRPQAAVSSSPTDPFASMDPLLGMDDADTHTADTQILAPIPSISQEFLIPAILDAKLDAKLNQIGERTDALEYKLDEMVNYVQAIEEENYNPRHTVSQLQVQQEDLENRARRQNLHFRGIPETVGDPAL